MFFQTNEMFIFYLWYLPLCFDIRPSSWCGRDQPSRWSRSPSSQSSRRPSSPPSPGSWSREGPCWPLMKDSKFIYDVQVSKLCWFSVSYQTVVNLTLIVLIGAYYNQEKWSLCVSGKLVKTMFVVNNLCYKRWILNQSFSGEKMP